MKDFVKITKETWQFYLTVLCVVLMPVVSNNIYILKELKSAHTVNGGLYNIFVEKAAGLDLINFWIALAGLAVILFLRHFSFMDRRVIEFQAVLPVKKRMFVIHDYLCNVGVIVIVWLITMCTFAVAQMDGALKAEAENAGKELFKVGCCYLLYLILAFTFLYLGVVICKNGIAGMIMMAAFLLIGFWLKGGMPVFDEVNNHSELLEALTPKYFLHLIEIIILLILWIIIAAEYRELSRGKWFYFRWLDYFAPVLCGILAAICYREDFDVLYVLLIAAAIVLGTILLFSYSRDRYAKRNNWEVK